MDDHVGRDVIDAALTVLARQGFDATSMEQIAEATGISADDIIRTIGTKESIVLSVTGDMLAAVVDALADVDPQTPVVEALLAAHASVLNDIIDGTGPVTFEQMRRMGKAISRLLICRRRWPLNVAKCSPMCWPITSERRQQTATCSAD